VDFYQAIRRYNPDDFTYEYYGEKSRNIFKEIDDFLNTGMCKKRVLINTVRNNNIKVAVFF
jgi:hypothetical protein